VSCEGFLGSNESAFSVPLITLFIHPRTLANAYISYTALVKGVIRQ
jgi:hypothetical protein